MDAPARRPIALASLLAVLASTLLVIGAAPSRVEAAEPAYAPFTSWSALVDRQFRDLTTKPPTPAQASSWASQLASGAKAKGDLVDGLRRGAENLANVDPVVRVYRAFLGRAPDAGGLQFWIARKRNVAPARTWTVTQIATEFTSSNEFKVKYGSLTNRQFVTQIYTDVLGRAADQGGVDYWTGKLDRKEKTKAQVVVGFSESNEYKTKQAQNTDVAVAYVYLLGRAPSTAETSDWVTRQKAGTAHAVLAAELLGSTAYRERIAPSAVAISSGQTFSCARMANATVRCWGGNGGAQIGDGTTIDRVKPVTVPGLTGITDIATGRDHACALASAGTVRCWGLNAYGQVGDGTKTNRTSPTTVSGLTGATEVAVGARHAGALVAGGAARCWGLNGSSQLGDGTSTSSPTPVAVSGLTGATTIVAGGYHTCVLVGGGGAKCFGSNFDGQIGDGSGLTAKVPTDVAGISGATAISGGADHTCVALPTGARCWGENLNRELGDGTATTRKLPVAVLTLTSATAVSTGGLHSCAISAGRVWCWGSNYDGQLGDGTTTSRWSPVLVAMR